MMKALHLQLVKKTEKKKSGKMPDSVDICPAQLMRAAYISRGASDRPALTEGTRTGWGEPRLTGLPLLHPSETQT